MKISITNIYQTGSDHYEVVMTYADTTLKAIIAKEIRRIELADGPFDLRSIQFDSRGSHSNCLFYHLMELTGALRMFCQDFWQLQDGKARAFPWDYGTYDDNVIPEAQKLARRFMEKEKGKAGH